MSEPLRYLLYRQVDGVCVNVVLWDGQTNFDPGEGLALELIPAGSRAWIGWARSTDGSWVEPPPPDPVEAPPE